MLLLDLDDNLCEKMDSITLSFKVETPEEASEIVNESYKKSDELKKTNPGIMTLDVIHTLIRPTKDGHFVSVCYKQGKC